MKFRPFAIVAGLAIAIACSLAWIAFGDSTTLDRVDATSAVRLIRRDLQERMAEYKATVDDVTASINDHERLCR